jgi:hypothetical protein
MEFELKHAQNAQQEGLPALLFRAEAGKDKATDDKR